MRSRGSQRTAAPGSARSKKAGASGRAGPSGKASESQRIAKWTVEKGLASKEQLQEAARIVKLRRDIDEHTSLDRVLFERDLLDADDVYQLQQDLQLRLVVCACGRKANAFRKKPGASVPCPDCQAKLPIPGGDPSDPFHVETRDPTPTRESLLLGILGVLVAGGLLTAGALEAWSGHLRYPALAAAGGFGLGAVLLGRSRRLVTAAGLGVALFTGLVLATALGNAPGSGAYGVLGVGAHRLVAPLAVGHLALLFLVAGPALTRLHPMVVLGLLLPAFYGLAFFVHGAAVGSADPFAGPGLLDPVPWFGHPGAVTLLALFPLAVLALLGAGLARWARGRPRTLLRDGGLVLGLALLSAYGLATGSLRGEIPAPALQAKVERTLAGRVDAHWQPDGAPSRGSTAVAATDAEAEEAPR